MKENVYLITDGLFFKIGKTRKDVEKRLKELQTGNSSNLQLIDSIKVKNASKVESIMHRMYKHRQQINEWFDLIIDDVKKFKENCLMIDNNIELLNENKDNYLI